jgi:hypothetical protein
MDYQYQRLEPEEKQLRRAGGATAQSMQQQTTVVMVGGQSRTNHLCWGVLTFLTGGLTLPCWMIACCINGV